VNLQHADVRSFDLIKILTNHEPLEIYELISVSFVCYVTMEKKRPSTLLGYRFQLSVFRKVDWPARCTHRVLCPYHEDWIDHNRFL